MYLPSAADTPQGRAMARAEVRFDNFRGFGTCKKKYSPKGGAYACPLHDAMRKERVEKYGYYAWEEWRQSEHWPDEFK